MPSPEDTNPAGNSAQSAAELSEFARTLRRVTQGMTQTDIGKAIGKTQRYVGGLLRDDYAPSLEALEGIAKAFPEVPAEEWVRLAKQDRKSAKEDERAMIARRAAEQAVALMSGADHLLRGFLDLQEKYPGKLAELPSFLRGYRSLTVEEAESVLRDLEDKIRRRVI